MRTYTSFSGGGGWGRGAGAPGGKGTGEREERGREAYGRREKRGREAGFPRWREAGEKRKKLRNIAQYFAIEKMQRGGSQNIQGGNRD